MKKITLCIAVCFLSNLFAQQPKNSPMSLPKAPTCETNTDKDNIHYCNVTVLNQFTKEHLKYPKKALKDSLQGMVIVKFNISATGMIENPIVHKDLGGGCGAEAIRLLKLSNKLLGRWTPAYQNGKAIAIQYTMPIRFIIPRSEVIVPPIVQPEVPVKQ